MIVPVAVPDVGVTVSQLPPPVVAAVAVQPVIDAAEGIVSCKVCDAGAAVPGAVKANCDGASVGCDGFVSVNVTGTVIAGAALLVPEAPGNVIVTVPA